MVQAFDEFFRTATGRTPHGYQARIAAGGLPAVVRAPTGTGKTGVILAWLWRRLYGPDRGGVPRRLVYALPQRSLVEQVAGEAERWLVNLGLANEVALHVVMGGAGESQRQWRLDMHRPAIVVGTVDSLVSKALNRGYGIARASYPVDFALVTNGAHWVIDEIQLCAESTTTLRQLAAFARTFGTAEPFGLTCMSATVPEGLLETVDNPVPGDVAGILPEERTGELAVRLDAARTIRRLAAGPGDYKAIAAAARDRHRAGTLTLVVLNTVDAAQEVYKRLRGGPADCLLLHSRFRGVERAELMAAVTGRPTGRIVVATQVVEAGIDLNAALLITEAAPWPSLVQRAGRCNRTGRVAGAELWWVRPVKAPPYEQDDVEAAITGLSGLEGRSLTGEQLMGCDVTVTEPQVAVLRRSDFIALFDTAPDLSGADIDIAPYVRDTGDLDVQLTWASWETEADGGRPPADAVAPPAQYRCRVPVGRVNALAGEVPVWRLDQIAGRWTRVHRQARARPGEVLLISAADGGYDPELGFDPAARGPVPGSPELIMAADPATGAEDTYGADSASVAQQRGWMSLDQHSQETRDQAAALLSVSGLAVPDGAAQAAVTAAYAHDIGKAHKIWQDALCRLAPAERRDEIDAGRPWAKSGGTGRLQFGGGVAFRHELASLLMLDGPLPGLLAGPPDPDLVRYLVLAHHGKLRVQVRDPGDLAVLAPGEASGHKLLGLEEGSVVHIPPLLGHPATELIVDLDPFLLGGERSWTRTALGLRDRYGPFVLAYLETLVRIADWRASAGAGGAAVTNTTITRHTCPGLRPEPLASYLAGLGLIRVIGEQADPAATAAWTPDGLAITTTVNDIAAWLADEYVPAPVLSPWNSGSGFGAKDKEPLRALEAMLAHPSARLDPLKAAIPVARQVVGKARERGWITDGAPGGDKSRVVQEFRNRCPDVLLPWIDATVVLAGENTVFPPLLGTGGNDGRLDFSTNFHQRLLDVISEPGPGRARSLAIARDLINGTEAEQLAGAAVGQFDPASAGGPGSSRFGAAESLVNPWAYVLLVEGALLFAASAVRRHQHAAGWAAMPFTVQGSPDESASGSAAEESRGEVWAPVWTREFTLAEITQMFAEARASWRGRPARRAVDFYAATRTLGVARGISEFTRYGLQRRNGLAFAAVPLARVDVREQPEVRLAAEIEDWAARFGGSDASAAVGQAARGFQAAHLEYARDGGALPLARLLAALTGLEQAVGRSGRARDASPVRYAPPARQFLGVLRQAERPELRLAVGLASCATLAGSGQATVPSRTLRQILLPIDPPAPGDRSQPNGRWRDAPLIPGFGSRRLPEVLADVLSWRSRTAAAECGEEKFRGITTFRLGIPVPAADLHAFAASGLNEKMLALFLRACLALNWRNVRHEWPPSRPAIPVTTLGLLQPLAAGIAPGDDGPALALSPAWASRLAAGQAAAVHGEAAARLRQAGWDSVPAPPAVSADIGVRIAAGLVPRCLHPRSVLSVIATRIKPLDSGEL